METFLGLNMGFYNKNQKKHPFPIKKTHFSYQKTPISYQKTAATATLGAMSLPGRRSRSSSSEPLIYLENECSGDEKMSFFALKNELLGLFLSFF
jgi:hypothetical protein